MLRMKRKILNIIIHNNYCHKADLVLGFSYNKTYKLAWSEMKHYKN